MPECRTDSPAYHVNPRDECPPTWVVNAVIETVEDRAEAEAMSADPRFADWLQDYVEGPQMAAIVSAALRQHRDAGKAALAEQTDLVMLAYKEHRVAQAEKDGEWADIELALMEAQE